MPAEGGRVAEVLLQSANYVILSMGNDGSGFGIKISIKTPAFFLFLRKLFMLGSLPL